LKIRFSKEAKSDLSKIAIYTLIQYGEQQMYTYKEQLKDEAERISKNPGLGTDRPELGAKLRSVVSGMHIIIYKIDFDCLTILRIIHGNRDIKKEFTATDFD
jgi:toxin ParE1/3/4